MERNQGKLVDKADFVATIGSWQDEGLKVVFTNGCFDILHPGHIDYMEKARLLGDRLVIGLNTDESVSRIKGELRPINDEIFRSRMLAALETVDLITFFNDDTPLDLIMEAKPDVLVKGSDYEIEEIVGSSEVLKLGGEVKTIPLLPGYSTTEVIKKIKEKTNGY
jgi:rfaE bifunctional protein nucleotidyltransferase chain/domain